MWYLDRATNHYALALYDVLGRQVEVVLQDTLPSGNHSVTLEAPGLSSGIYFYTVQADGYARTEPLLIVR